ncbi:MAG: UBA/THIF-type binding protein [Candidatus Doudnabacteria bacterium]|nr:UBA/THIF-type binding protein [Candidatus Doudnabacteria bacterium]
MKTLKEKVDRESWKPIKLKKDQLVKELNSYQKKGVGIIDQYADLTEEAFLLQNPEYRFNKDYQAHFQKFLDKHFKGKDPVHAGNWFYYPWLNQVIHFLPEDLHFHLRTGRNRFLINEDEQKRFYNSNVGIMGMSVGSHVALTIVMTGGAKHIKLADPDIISGSNLNRIRTGFQNVGTGKMIVVARQIMEINPYAEIELFAEGVSDANIEKFILSPKLDLIVEEMDNPYLKLKTRYIAKPHGVPIIMAADNADSIIVDIERFDLNKKTPILHGILGKMTPEDVKHVQPQDLPRTIAKMAGANIADLKMIESVMQVGRTIYSWPQLGNAATLCGAVLTYLARKVILKEDLKSGRYEVNLDSIFVPFFESKSQVQKRDKKRKGYLKMMGL